MPTPPLTHTERERRKHLVEQCLREGYSPVGVASKAGSAVEEACRRDGRSSGFFSHWLAREVGHERMGEPSYVPDWRLYEPRGVAPAPAAGMPVGQRWRIKVPARRAPEEPILTVLALGDIHDKPGRTKQHLRWAGRFAADLRPDRIIQIGDWMSLDSLSGHETRGSQRDHDRPAFHDDLASAEESLYEFDRDCPEGIERDVTLGNHEWRAARVANDSPKESGDALIRVEEVFARFRWKTHPFGRFLYVSSVGFVHVPLNQMGRPYGGKHSENTIGNDATHSVVWGHDHKFRVKQLAKIGPNNAISLCNLGTFMPYGTIEDYTTGASGWSYGVVVLRIQSGIILSANLVDNLELERRFA